jgi:CHAT domain-containing protein
MQTDPVNFYRLLLLFLSCALGASLTRGQVPTSTPKATGTSTAQASPSPPQITDPLVKSFNERVVRLGSLIGNTQKQFFALRDADSKAEVEGKCQDILRASRSLYQELGDEKLLANISQTGLTKSDFRTLLKSFEISSLQSLGLVHKAMHQPRESVDYNVEALRLVRKTLADNEITSSKVFSQVGLSIRVFEISTARVIATTLNSDLDKPQEALEYARQAINAAERLQYDDERNAALAKNLAVGNLTDIANIYRKLNDRQKAIESLLRALQICQSLPDKEREVSFLNFALGLEYHSDLDFKNALFYFQTELDRSERLKDKESEARMVGLMALVYEDLNDEKRAGEYWRRQLTILQSSEYDESIKNSISNLTVQALKELAATNREIEKRLAIANAYRRLKQYDNALMNYDKAISLIGSRSPGDTETVISLIGNLYLDKDDWPNGTKYYKRAIAISVGLADKTIYAKDLSDLAYSEFKSNLLQDALMDADRSLVVYQSLPSANRIVRGYATTLSLLAQIHNARGNRRLAIFYEKQAVNAIQRERQQLKNLDVQSQRGFLQRNEKPYRRLVEWLTNEGRISEAEQVMRMLKEDEYFQYLHRDYQVANDLLFTVGLEPDEAAAAERYDQFADQLTAVGREYGELEAEKRKPEYERRPFPKQARLDELDKMLNDARVVSQKFLDDLDEKFKQKDVRVAEIKSGYQAMLKDMNARRTAVVSTLVDDDRLTIFITTADSQRAHAVDIKAVEVNKLVSDFRAAVMNPKIDPRDAGKKLYDIVIGPIEKDLVGINADTIVWSLDGALRYAPMAALWDGQHYLAERYANVLITLASQKYLERPISDKSKWRALGVGVSRESKGFPGLKAVPDELDCIITDPVNKTVSLHPQCQQGVINGTKLLDDKFTKESFKNALGRYAVVHVASHFSLQPGDAYRSFLLLGGGATERDRKLMVSEINQSLFGGVEILTLSACNTAVGTERSNGLEVEGFGALAQKEGAKSVIATLWEVADSSTRDFMVKFYSLYDSPASTNKAQAMRQAQLALLIGGNKTTQPSNTVRSSVRLDDGNGLPKTFPLDPKAKYSHPYYWAPFILIGNWR